MRYELGTDKQGTPKGDLLIDKVGHRIVVKCSAKHHTEVMTEKKEKHRLCTERCKEGLEGCPQNPQDFVIPFTKWMNSILTLLLTYTMLMLLPLYSSVWYKTTLQVYLLFLRIT